MTLYSEYIDLEDEEIIGKYKLDHNPKWMSVLYRRYASLTYGLCLKYLKNKAQAEDASMDIFEKLPSRIVKHKIEKFKPWLYSVSRNHCLEQLRKEKRQFPKEKEAAFMYSEQLFHPDDINKEEELKALEKCIEELPDSQKKCIRLFYLESKTYQFVADALDISWNQVRSFIQNGRRNLKICLEKNGRK